ncbi:MAG: thioredoxin domain-containing protein [Deltaproteobacteria bacterium]|nr:thioredoxin domain-containing protein [Deltaproteobacteria bacterium]
MAKGQEAANRLKNEKSPYLQQHAGNPIDWYPWSEEAFLKAKREDKPVLISIGYSACHWCHVMERESFEDIDTAKVMNENFVNIKVDREERPELDSLYMKAVQTMTGHAGWPLTVFTTPDGVPFYGGSYFPPEDSHGLPAFKKVLLAVNLAYKKNKKRIDAVTTDIEQVLSHRGARAATGIDPEVSGNAFEAARLFFDPVHGGFGRGTKFPHSMFLRFLLKYYRRTGEKDALLISKRSLIAMAEGGIYDHVGGGFHRYSVDENWDIPHFEKMLYDNALLAGAYTAAHEATKAGLFRDVAMDTITYMLRDMRNGEGGFYSAQDADVDGEEGAYYLWDYGEVEMILGAEGAKKLASFYSITGHGNYEGRNMLRINYDVKPPEAPVDPEIKGLCAELLKARKRRRAPDIDRKIITGWNGLVISALAAAGRSFRRSDFIDAAKKCAVFLLSSVRDDEGRLLRYYLDGKTRVRANLEDYALFADSLLALHNATGERRWLDEAGALTEEMIRLFYEEDEGLFYDTGIDQERLFIRERDLNDNDVPSGNSAAAALLLRASRLFENKRYRDLAEEILRTVEGIKDEPLSYGNFLCVHESILGEKASPH